MGMGELGDWGSKGDFGHRTADCRPWSGRTQSVAHSVGDASV